MNTSITSPKTRQIANIAALVMVLVVNFLSTTLPLNGVTAEQISDALPTFITPAGFAFSIWGLIYLGLIGFIVYQALPAQQDNPFIRRIGPLFVISSLANAGWLFAWHYGQYLLSVFIMLALLATLGTIYYRLNVGRPPAPGQPEPASADVWLVQRPFSLYLGWITVATIVNIASVVKYLGWDGWGIAEPTWSAIMMLVAAIVAGLLLYNRSDLAYAGVLVWALAGIWAKYETPVITNTAVVAAALVILVAVVGWFRTRGQRRPQVRPHPA